MIRYLVGHVIEVLKTLETESVHCVVTSPPYWGLRKYAGQQEVVWGDPQCEHEWRDEVVSSGRSGGTRSSTLGEKSGGHAISEDGIVRSIKRSFVEKFKTYFCAKCDAWRGALGLEPTPELYVAHLVEVFREVRRVLRKDGTVWLNMGDCYASSPPGNKNPSHRYSAWKTGGVKRMSEDTEIRRSTIVSNLKPKDLVGMPWRVAFALQADGWWLRSDIIWSKPNPMPDSVEDRPTKSHEYVLLLAKSGRYFYDADAVREPATRDRSGNVARKENLQPTAGGKHFMRSIPWENVGQGRNKRTVWQIPTHPYPGAHFATFPEALVQPCILAGTSERGCCARCGKPWIRMIQVSYVKSPVHGEKSVVGRHYKTGANRWDGSELPRVNKKVSTVGWEPGCHCQINHPTITIGTKPCIVLDPFAGAGTTLLVARRLGRDAIGIDICKEYREMALKRGELGLASLEKFTEG